MRRVGPQIAKRDSDAVLSDVDIAVRERDERGHDHDHDGCDPEQQRVVRPRENDGYHGDGDDEDRRSWTAAVP
jgi:hypothetical protein